MVSALLFVSTQYDCGDEETVQQLEFFGWIDRNNVSRHFDSCRLEQQSSAECVKVCTVRQQRGRTPPAAPALPVRRLVWSRQPWLDAPAEPSAAERRRRRRYQLGRFTCWGKPRQSKGNLT